MTTQTSAERIATIREEAAQRGLDVTGLSDVELLLQELTAARKEAYDAGHKVQSILMDRAKWERKARSSLQRQAQLDRVRTSQLYLDAAVRDGLHPLTSLVYRVQQLPDRLSPKAMAAFKAAIGDIGYELQVAKRRTETNPGLKLLAEQRAETLRLIEHITERGQALHKELATGSDIGCECPGCELIVGMGDVPLPEVPDGK